jgi:very-short-patch-repair endonuclease
VKELSPGEEAFALHCRAEKLTPEREYPFCPGRKWRADFAFISERVLVEIEGGTWSLGRHTRGSGFEADLEKYNTAAILGWRVLRFTTNMVMAGEAINDTLKILGKS